MALRWFHNCNENLRILDDKIKKAARESMRLKGIKKVIEKQMTDLGLDLENLTVKDIPNPKEVSKPEEITKTQEIPKEPIKSVVETVSTPKQSAEVTDSAENMETDEMEIIEVRAVDEDDNVVQSVNLQVSKGMSEFISPELFKFLPAESQQVLANRQRLPIPDDITALMATGPMFETTPAERQLVPGHSIILPENTQSTVEQVTAEVVVTTTPSMQVIPTVSSIQTVAVATTSVVSAQPTPSMIPVPSSTGARPKQGIRSRITQGPVPEDQQIPGKYYCDACPHYYKNKGDLQKHKKRCLITEKPYTCPDINCNKTYYTKRGAEEHYYKDHLQQYKYVCDKCSAGFSFRSEYNPHIKHCTPYHGGVRN